MLLRGKAEKNESGILLALSSLPSNYGIGTLGIESYNFVDFLKSSKQRYWQLLPLVPLGEGNSPYKSASCFAGEILYIDIDFLVRDGYLTPDDIKQKDFPKNTDYDKVREFKIPLLKKAVENFNTRRSDYIRFLKDNEHWLTDYALFMTALSEQNTESILELEDGIKYRIPLNLKTFAMEHRKEIRFYKITQFLFFSQYYALKRYANKNGIKLIGDIPFYVSLDSAEVWKEPDNFKLGRDFTPVLVAGVPPDVFSADGQLWGNPIYDWEYQRKNEYLWWQKRLKHCKKMYDVIRIDHFRAFADYYTIPYGSPNARSGKWEKGAGLQFWKTVIREIGSLNVIAEDLGSESVETAKLIEDTGFPNMKVLQFAFSGDMQNPFLPKNYNRNCVCYTGTHDNDTTLGWYNSATSKERIMANKTVPYMENSPMPIRMIAAAMNSKAKLVIIPMQDWLCLDSSARMNMPGVARGNWEWRMDSGSLTTSLAEKIKKISKGRN